MSIYRVGNHQPQNAYRDDAYIGVMFTAEDAALVVEALNDRAELLAALAALVDPDPCSYDHGGECQAHGQGSDPFCAHARARELLSGQPGPRPIRGSAGEWDNAKPHRIYSRWVNASDHTNRSVYAAILEAYAVGLATERPVAPVAPDHPADPCTDEWQSPHRAGSRPNMCATCSEASAVPASTCEGCNRVRRGMAGGCPTHDAVFGTEHRAESPGSDGLGCPPRRASDATWLAKTPGAPARATGR